MTTPPRALSVAGLTAALAATVVLMTGALSVPAPDVRPLLDVATSSLAFVRAVAVQAAEGLPRPKVISDPNRMPVLLWREGFQGEPAGGPEYATIAADGSWLALPDPRGRRVVRYSYLGGGVALPFDGSTTPREEPRDLTRSPTIVNEAQVIAAVRREYPQGLRDRGVGATVGVQLLVGADGRPSQVRVGQFSLYRELDEAALRVAEAYRFSPAEANGEPVAVWVSHPIDFRVD